MNTSATGGRNRNAYLVALLISLLATTSHGEINIVDSLEWMTVDAPLIVRGKVTGYEDTTKQPGAVIYRDVTVEIEEVLKGKLRGRSLKVRLRLLSDRGTVREWRESRHSYLFFLRKGRVEDDEPLAGRWVLREKRQSVIDLDNPQRVYKADMKKAKDTEETLRIVRKWADQKMPRPAVGEPNIFKPQAGYLRLEVAPGCEFLNEIWWGSTCYMNVPAEEEYRPLAMAKAESEHYHERARGADMLRNYPGPETVKLLTATLDDPGEARWLGGTGELVRISYPARKAAYHALLALGENPRKPVFEREPTPEEVRKERDRYWKQALREVLPKDWAVTSIRGASEPHWWTRADGGEGLAVECRKLKVTAEDEIIGTFHPVFVLYVMPLDWEGKNREDNGEKLAGRKYNPPKKALDERQVSPARYLGHNGRKHFFCSIVGHVGWRDPYTRIQRYFPLKIESAASPPERR